MKEKLRRLIPTAFMCWLLCSCAAANDNGIGVTLINYTFDTVGYGYTITINAQVTNNDTLPFTGSIDFGLRTDNYNLTNADLFNKPPYSGSNTITLYPHETIPSIFSVHIEPQYFLPGPDVVVVWPICTSPVTDSIVIPIVIQAPSAVEDENEIQFNYIVTGTDIYLFNLPRDVNFKQVRIYDILGRVVSDDVSGNITDVKLPAAPHGIYMAEMLTTDNRRRIIKFFH